MYLNVMQAFGWLGFLVALAWIYLIANEVVAVLQVSLSNIMQSQKPCMYDP
jgi:hypothetical protein